MASNASGSSGKDPWAWLGLLKWSLAYSDGTTSNEDLTPMSAQDKAFLEKVMKEGIIDENERMKVILKELASLLETWQKETFTSEQEEQAQDFLEELRDIVEQIDYARAFAAMKGLPFLLGCINERQAMPRSTRLACLGLVATLCQNNPPVQKELLELGSIKTLSDLFFLEDSSNESDSDASGALRAKIIQAVSANVRSHELAEAVFCQLEQAVPLIQRGLGVTENAADPSHASNTAPASLRKRTLFLLRALVTSDSSTRSRVRLFNRSICWIADHYLDDSKEDSAEIREMALELIQQVLQQQKSVNAVLSRKDAIVATGVRRVSAIRGMMMMTPGGDEDAEFAAVELQLWESVIALLARAVPDEENETAHQAPLLLEGGSGQGSSTLQAQ